MLKTTLAYIKSMRLYYAFVTGIPGWLGLAYYDFIGTHFKTVEVLPSATKKLVILLLLFMSWGINQIINDYLGLKTDKINAPERPMVTGELPAKLALFISILLLIASLFVTWFYLQPIAIIPLLVGVMFNVVYEYAKGYGIFGNIVFGLMISMCPLYGFFAAGPSEPPYFDSNSVSILLLVFTINGLMTFYTYFKDYKGDKATGKKTIVVKHGIHKARKIGFYAAFFPTILFIFLFSTNLLDVRLNKIFIILGFLSLFLHVWTGISFYKNPSGKHTYYSLSMNFRACTGAQSAFIALFNAELALLLFIFSYVFIGFLFDLYSNVKS